MSKAPHSDTAGEMPDAPPLGSLRIASLSDVMRIGIIATAGFRYSPLFRWERPYHEAYPDDTIVSYRTKFKSAIEAPNSIVLVVEDDYQPTENDSTSAIIPKDNGWNPPSEGEKAVVGVAVFNLEPGSNRKGKFQNDTGHCPTLPKEKNRDLNIRHYTEWIKVEEEAFHRNFPSYSEMSMLVVHPAYWRRGHGTMLVKWSQDLASVDQVPQGVSAADMGERLYLQLGYKLVDRVSMPGDEDDAEGISTGLLVYKPT